MGSCNKRGDSSSRSPFHGMNLSTPILLYPRIDFHENGLAEGDCACPRSIPGKSDESAFTDLWEKTKFQKAEAEVFRFNPDFLTLFSAYTHPSMVLLNRSAYALWQAFENADTPQHVIEMMNFGPAERKRSLRILQMLLWFGYLVNPDNIQPGVIEDSTLTAWLHVTNACNLRCSYCYIHKTNLAMDAKTGEEAVKAIFRSARLHGFKTIKLKYAGGEPLLNFPLILQLDDLAGKLAEQLEIRLDRVILTNATPLNSSIIEELLHRNIRLMISLDGIDETHDRQRPFTNGRGSLSTVLQKIELAKASGLKPQICITLSARNANGLPDLVAWILDQGLPFSINFYRETPLATDGADLNLEESTIVRAMLAAFSVIESNLPEYSLLTSLLDRTNLAFPHQRACSAGKNYMVIDSLGRISKCQMEIDRPVSSIKSADPLAIIRSSPIGVQNPAVDEMHECRSCEWKYWCAGGCPITSYQAGGSYLRKSPYCNIYKVLFPEVLRLETRRLLSRECYV